MKRTSLTIALALSASLGLAACGSDDTTGAGVSAGATDTVQTPEATGTGTEDATTDDTTTDATGTDDDATGSESGTAAAPAPDDLTAVALEAIAAAEAETGGTAYQIDDQDDDGTWEVDVRVDDRSVEVTVSADGTTVEETEEDDLDDDDRAALDAATITLADAIGTAVEEVGGVLDDAELDEEDGTYAWEITVDGAGGGDDVEVLVAVTGEVLSTTG